jgi:hypothetical protein
VLFIRGLNDFFVDYFGFCVKNVFFLSRENCLKSKGLIVEKFHLSPERTKQLGAFQNGDVPRRNQGFRECGLYGAATNNAQSRYPRRTNKRLL